MSIRVSLAFVVSLSIIVPAVAQPLPGLAPVVEGEIEGGTPAYIKEETPEQRRARVGAEDPGLNPDPEQEYWRFGKRWKIERYDRQWAAYDREPGFVRPMAMVNFAFEIYQQNEKYVWVWVPTMEELMAAAQTPVAPEETSIFTAPQIAYLKKIAPEFSEVTPPLSNKVVRFEDSSKGLPSEGSWRNSAAFADMNGDGHLDIIAPPERGTRSLRPAIFLGDGKGGWTPWAAAVWPFELQYGTVVAADFDGDGKMDLAFGQHLTGPRVLLGDGKGRFRDGSRGMEEIFPTRRIVAADVDADGDMDLIAIYEGPTPGLSMRKPRIRAYINDRKGGTWTVADVAEPGHAVAGDWLAVGKFNKDRYPDIVSSNNYFQRPETLWESSGPAKWKIIDWQDGVLVPYLSVYTAVAAGRFSSRTLDDAIVSYDRSWPDGVENLVDTPPLRRVVGIDRISFAGKQPVRKPILRYASDREISAMAVGDFDGDGKQDIIFTHYAPREAVLLLGDGKGGFRRATVEGLQLADNPNYDINIADVNGDGLPDVLVMYESTSESPFGRQNGSIRLFLNRGATSK